MLSSLMINTYWAFPWYWNLDSVNSKVNKNGEGEVWKFTMSLRLAKCQVSEHWIKEKKRGVLRDMWPNEGLRSVEFPNHTSRMVIPLVNRLTWQRSRATCYSGKVDNSRGVHLEGNLKSTTGSCGTYYRNLEIGLMSMMRWRKFYT